MGATAVQFPGELRRGLSCADATQEQHQLRGPAPRAVHNSIGEGIKDSAASAALIIQYRSAATAMDAQLFPTRPAAWTG